MNLIQIALAAEEFFRQQPVIQFSDAQCVRTKHVHASCDLCAEVCPTGAITLEGGIPTLEVERCIKCGVCLHACPVGAFERGDGFFNLLHCAECMREHETLDIACVHHPSAERTDRAVDGVIQIGNCLSELGPSAYIGLKAIGTQRIRVRLDACDACPLRVLRPQIEQSVDNARHILSAFNLDAGLTIVSTPDETGVKRPVHQSKNPPVSRRGFFSMLTAGTTTPARAIASAHGDQPATGKRTSRERQRLLNALRIVNAPDSNIDPAVTLETGDFTQFAVAETCTACGLCERVCPVGAIRVQKSETAFAVNFAPHLCTNCGLCVAYCDPGALQMAGKPSASDVLDAAVLQLHSGALRQCERCKTLFAGQAEDTLCAVCRYRRENPTGISLPDALLAKLPQTTRERLSQYRARSGHEVPEHNTQRQR